MERFSRKKSKELHVTGAKRGKKTRDLAIGFGFKSDSLNKWFDLL